MVMPVTGDAEGVQGQLSRLESLPIQALRAGVGEQTASVRTQSFIKKKKKKTVNSHSGQQLEMDLKKMTGKEPVIEKA